MALLIVRRPYIVTKPEDKMTLRQSFALLCCSIVFAGVYSILFLRIYSYFQ